MKELKTNKIEKALSIYKETVSPNEACFTKILNQIPEREIKTKRELVIHSPYIWLTVTQTLTIFSILFVLFPSLSDIYIHKEDPFYLTDKMAERFESKINDEDIAQIEKDFNNNLK